MVWYAICWVGDGGIYSCGHEHGSVADAMHCLVPDGGDFIRACESGVFRVEGDALEVARMELGERCPPWRGEEVLLSALLFVS